MKKKPHAKKHTSKPEHKRPHRETGRKTHHIAAIALPLFAALVLIAVGLIIALFWKSQRITGQKPPPGSPATTNTVRVQSYAGEIIAIKDGVIKLRTVSLKQPKRTGAPSEEPGKIINFAVTSSVSIYRIESVPLPGTSQDYVEVPLPATLSLKDLSVGMRILAEIP